MKMMSCSALIFFFSSFISYGSEGSWVEDAGLGLGKAALGLGCAYAAVTTLLQSYPDTTNTGENDILKGLRYCFNDLKKHGTGFIWKDKNSYEIDYALNTLLSRVCLLGASTYGGYKCMASAYDSFKEVYKKITNPPADPPLEEETSNDEKKDGEEEENEGSWVKKAGLGLGKAALGLGCAYTAIAASLTKSWDDDATEYRNEPLWLLRDYFFKDPGEYYCNGHLFHNIDNSYAMNECLNIILARLCLIGVCTYGACKCTVSAYNSFKGF